MPAVLHILDCRTRPEMLRQLFLLAGPQDEVVSAGPPPEGDLPLAVRAVHRPLGSAQLAGLRMRPRGRDAQVLHAWSPQALRAGKELALALGKPLVASLPCVPPRAQLEALRRDVGPGLFSVTVPTEPGRRKLLRAGLPEPFVHVLPPAAGEIADRPATRRRVREALGLADAACLIVAPDGMVRGAGQEYASWAHAIVRQTVASLYLVFSAGGPLEKHVRTFAATTGYDDEVFFTGRRLAAEEALAAADLAVFFHERDVGVAALAEAMAAGLPIAASRTEEIAACVPDGEAALLSAPRDPRAASAVLLRLLEEPQLARRLAAEARRRATVEFSVGVARRRLAGIYAATAEATVY